MAKYAYHQLDANAKAIRQALEAAGFSVYPSGRPLDYIIAKGRYTALLEVKTAKGKLRPSQEKFIDQWPGDVWLVRTVEDVMKLARLNSCDDER